MTTEDIPVAYADGKLVPAEGFSETDAANFIKNINSVTVGETKYSTGKHGVTVIDSATGEILVDAASGENKVFPEDGTYQLSVTATGYENAYEFEFVKENVPASSESASESTSETASSTSSGSGSSSGSSGSSSSTRSSSSSSGSSSSSSGSESPKTADKSVAIPIAALVLTAGIGFISSDKKKK